jgi:hypothetical protein
MLYLLLIWLEYPGPDEFAVLGCERIGDMFRGRATGCSCEDEELRMSNLRHTFRNVATCTA